MFLSHFRESLEILNHQNAKVFPREIMDIFKTRNAKVFSKLKNKSKTIIETGQLVFFKTHKIKNNHINNYKQNFQKNYINTCLYGLIV